MKTIVLTGGGTAGHVMPNMALLPELQKKFDKMARKNGRNLNEFSSNYVKDYLLGNYSHQ